MPIEIRASLASRPYLLMTGTDLLTLRIIGRGGGDLPEAGKRSHVSPPFSVKIGKMARMKLNNLHLLMMNMSFLRNAAVS